MGAAAAGLPNVLNGTLFNDYALGSRIQYQVRSPGGEHWLVEKPAGRGLRRRSSTTPVTLGWRPEDSILVRD